MSYYVPPETVFLYNIKTFMVRHVVVSYCLSFEEDGLTLTGYDRIRKHIKSIVLPEETVEEIAEKANSIAALNTIISIYKQELLQEIKAQTEDEISIISLLQEAYGYVKKQNKIIAFFDSGILLPDVRITADPQCFCFQDKKAAMQTDINSFYENNTPYVFEVLCGSSIYEIGAVCQDKMFHVTHISPAETMQFLPLFRKHEPAWKIAEQAKRSKRYISSLFATR